MSKQSGDTGPHQMAQSAAKGAVGYAQVHWHTMSKRQALGTLVHYQQTVRSRQWVPPYTMSKQSGRL